MTGGGKSGGMNILVNADNFAKAETDQRQRGRARNLIPTL
jgi:hypothetical protein